MRIFSTLRQKIVNQTVVGLLILQLLNLSVDCADISPLAEDLSINEIESIVELVLEHVINDNNMIQESDEDDFESVISVYDLNLFSFAHQIETYRASQQIDKHPVRRYQPCFESVAKTIQTPPPKS